MDVNSTGGCTTGGVHDRQVVSEIIKAVEGVFVGDPGSLVKEVVFWELSVRHRPILRATKKHLKRVMTGEQEPDRDGMGCTGYIIWRRG
ncbi:MAG: hypothetical protein LBB80_01715 [Treponema sp.]|nr:hypothetical protein [Treponema sp.]